MGTDRRTEAEQTLLRFDQLFHELGLRLADDSPLKCQADLIREAYRDRATLNDEEGQRKWGHRIPDFVLARISLERFVAATKALA